MLIVQKVTGLENEQNRFTELKGMRQQRKRGGLKDISSSICLFYAPFVVSHKKNNEEGSEIKSLLICIMISCKTVLQFPHNREMYLATIVPKAHVKLQTFVSILHLDESQTRRRNTKQEISKASESSGLLIELKTGV